MVLRIEQVNAIGSSNPANIRIVLDGLRGEDSKAELCRGEGLSESMYYKWSKEFMEAGKKRLSGDIVREASTNEVFLLRPVPCLCSRQFLRNG